jgi:hypothetical protein
MGRASLLPLLLAAALIQLGCEDNGGVSTGPWSPGPSTSGSWEWQNPLPQGNDLVDVVFVDASQGWAVGGSGTILHTTDGGATWSFQSSGTDLRLQSACFLDASTGWVVGSDEGG